MIGKYDVYKVETIADSYMCVSGLPEANGARHIQEIGQMSLEMLHMAKDVVISHMDNKALQLRIGFHSGELATDPASRASVTGLHHGFASRVCVISLRHRHRPTSLGLTLVSVTVAFFLKILVQN